MKTVREALYDTIHRNTKPLKVIADELGLSESYLTRAALPDAEDSDTGTGCRFPLKKLIPLVRSTGDYTVLDTIENALGRVGVALPPPVVAPPADICMQTMKAVANFGELVRTVYQALADNKIKPQERDQILTEGYKTVQTIMQLMTTANGAKL